ncbi:MAG: FtsW/RodA/SpoVE family cell cycle protein [Thermotogaceae bacterium]|nr:FtsW/RodA/SpoVE family cell cycle protein [Thermotogaceae bacterium]
MIKENKRYEVILPILVLILIIFGIFVLKSAVTRTEGYENYPIKQVLWDALALFFLISVIFLKKNLIRDFAIVLYIISIILLIYVLIKAPTVGGSRRWITFRYFNFQPSELSKLSLIILLPLFFEKPSLKNFILSLLITALPVSLIFLEPDLGTSVLVCFIWLSIAIASKVKFRYILAIILIFLIALPIFYMFGLKDYQKDRIKAFFNPQAHQRDAAYNVIRSKSAIASGGLLGRGYMKGPANLFGFVPVDYSDFVVAVIGEELGFLGIAFLISLYTAIMVRMYKMYEKVEDEYWKLIIIGVSSTLFFHVFENMLMCIGAMPVTGIPLPFISYGGSSTVIFGIMLGLVMKAYSITKIGRKVL